MFTVGRNTKMALKLQIKRDGGMTVSEGTLRSEDLLVNFCNTLYELGKKRQAKKLWLEGAALLEKIDEMEYQLRDTFIDNEKRAALVALLDTSTEALMWVVDELFDLLNANAPSGYYFGASEGDGACFGFWKAEDE
jgi:hypothetical protein